MYIQTNFQLFVGEALSICVCVDGGGGAGEEGACIPLHGSKLNLGKQVNM